MAQWHWHSPVEINLTGVFDGQLQATIGPFAMSDLASVVAKLAQYPGGTVFHLSADAAADWAPAATRAIHEAASQYGLVVEE